MAFADAEIERLKAFCTRVESCVQGAIDYFLLIGLRLPECTPSTVDALLCVGDRGEGYATRLFFAEVLIPKDNIALNWNHRNVRILERNWHAYSWKVPREMPLDHILREHLKPLA